MKNLIYRMHAQSPKSGKFPSELLWNAASSYARWLLVMTSGACFSMDYVLRVVRALPGEAKADPGTAVEEGGGVVFRRGLSAGSVKDRQTCELFTPVGTVCEHHILPFFGKVYLCLLAKEGGEVEATSAELQAIVWKYSRQLQLQERLVAQIADDQAALHLIEKLLVQLMGYCDLNIRDQVVVLLNMLYDGVDWQIPEAFRPVIRCVG